jgi:luciferase family oxidoreductase group 1
MVTVPAPLRLSVLDLSPIPYGGTAADALASTVELARLAEARGYARFWVAEHHNTSGLASATPAVLIAHVAAATSTVRVGSGGVMLPNHSPLAVAESFRLLEALHPGRIDLGIGRAPGTDGLTALALRRSRQALTVDDFPERMVELVGFLTGSMPDGHLFHDIVAAPVGVGCPELWLLGSSGYGGDVAAQLGLGCAFAAHINPAPAVETLRAYRDRYQPSSLRKDPAAILALSVVCGETPEHAEELAATVDLMFLRFAQGQTRGRPPSPEEARTHVYTPQEDALRRSNRTRYLVGDAQALHDVIVERAEAAHADEVMITTMVSEPTARRRTYELLGDAFALDADTGLVAR